MAKPFHALLGDSLNRVKGVSCEGVVRSKDISRRDRERLLKGGWLHLVVPGWYIFCSPQARKGESTAWYSHYWAFVQQYLYSRFQDQYCLSAESSIDLHVGSTLIPQQLVVITQAAINQVVSLPFGTGIVIYQDRKNFPQEVISKGNIRVMFLPLALCRVSKTFFNKSRINAEIALELIRDPSQLNTYLLEFGMVASANRLAGAYQALGQQDFASQIINAMRAAGYEVKSENPFEQNLDKLKMKVSMTSPYKIRIIHMWQLLRNDIITAFPKKALKGLTFDKLMKQIDHIYVNDAYHSLSIEGYQVTTTLIKKIKQGHWDPTTNEDDHQQRNALAAKGYYEAFNRVKISIKEMYNGDDPIDCIKHDLSQWYQALFSPSVEAGLVQRKHLAGYRNERVYIRNSLHTPPPKEAILDCMDAFFDCLHEEENPIVRAILGHFIFVFIHPYMDGNGRMGRFLMNALWVLAGYPWTIIRVESREQYLKSLEKASVNNQIIDFVQLIAKEMNIKW